MLFDWRNGHLYMLVRSCIIPGARSLGSDKLNISNVLRERKNKLFYRRRMGWGRWKGRGGGVGLEVTKDMYTTGEFNRAFIYLYNGAHL
jgi:hypothetical protein